MVQIHDLRRIVKDEKGDPLLRTVTIPFRPEYVLVESADRKGYVPLPEAVGRTPRGFRFALSEAAMLLVREQDSNVHPRGGFSTLAIKFDSAFDKPAVIEATFAVRAGDP